MYHMNNDTPGTDDGADGGTWRFLPGIVAGRPGDGRPADRVDGRQRQLRGLGAPRPRRDPHPAGRGDQPVLEPAGRPARRELRRRRRRPARAARQPVAAGRRRDAMRSPAPGRPRVRSPTRRLRRRAGRRRLARRRVGRRRAAGGLDAVHGHRRPAGLGRRRRPVLDQPDRATRPSTPPPPASATPATTPASTAPRPATAAAAPIPAELAVILATIRHMETGGDYTVSVTTSTASGAYGFLDSSWGGYGGYARAKDAPPAVQDAKAAELATYILNRNGGDVSTIPVSWYIGHVPGRRRVGHRARGRMPATGSRPRVPAALAQQVRRADGQPGRVRVERRAGRRWSPVDTSATCRTVVVDVGEPGAPQFALTQAQSFLVDAAGRAVPDAVDPCDPGRALSAAPLPVAPDAGGDRRRRRAPRQARGARRHHDDRRLVDADPRPRPSRRAARRASALASAPTTHARRRSPRHAEPHLLAGVPMAWMRRWPGDFPLFVADAVQGRFRDVDGHRVRRPVPRRHRRDGRPRHPGRHRDRRRPGEPRARRRCCRPRTPRGSPASWPAASGCRRGSSPSARPTPTASPCASPGPPPAGGGSSCSTGATTAPSTRRSSCSTPTVASCPRRLARGARSTRRSTTAVVPFNDVDALAAALGAGRHRVRARRAGDDEHRHRPARARLPRRPAPPDPRRRHAAA